MKTSTKVIDTISPRSAEISGNTVQGRVWTGAMLLRRWPPRPFAVLSAVLLLAQAPVVARAQTADSLPIHGRVRVDLHGTERSLLRRPISQPIAGTLLGIRGDTLLLSVGTPAEPLRVPHASIAAFHVSRGRPHRLESALRRALVPTLASAALSALRASLHPGSGDPSPGDAAWTAARRTLVVTAGIGFLFPRERWRRTPLPRPMPPAPVEPPVPAEFPAEGAERGVSGKEVALVIADQWMPGTTGVELLSRARDLHPGAKRVLLIDAMDHSALTVVLQATALGRIDHHLHKPWTPADDLLHPPITELLCERWSSSGSWIAALRSGTWMASRTWPLIADPASSSSTCLA